MASKHDHDGAKRKGGPPPLKQAPPWKIAIPFAVFCMIVLIQYCFSKEPLALVAVFIAAAMGTVWTYGAWTVCRDAKRQCRSAVPHRPRLGEGSVISRARIGGIFNPVGYLLATDNALVWVPWREGVKTGDTIVLDTGSSANIVAAFKDIVRFRSKAGIFGGETLTFFFDSGSCRLRLLDPEGLTNLLSLMPDLENGSSALESAE